MAHGPGHAAAPRMMRGEEAVMAAAITVGHHVRPIGGEGGCGEDPCVGQCPAHAFTREGFHIARGIADAEDSCVDPRDQR
jgi:hypothetical protein